MKKFKQLIINHITEEITGSTMERLAQVKQSFESEMVNNGRIASPTLCKDWLQGLCSTVEIPFMYCDVIAWNEQQLGRKAKNDAEESRWCEHYYKYAGNALFDLLYGSGV